MKKGVVFDLDGVLTFTDEYHYQAWKELADEEGIEFNRTINNRLRGISRMASLDIILEKAKKPYSDEEKLAMATKKNNRYIDLLDQLSPKDASDDVRYTLETLKKKGVRLAVGSSSKNTMKILTRTNLLSYFDEIADGTMISHSKPNPEVFLLGAKKLGLEPSECFVVEDAKAGIQAGHDGGFQTIGIGPDVKDYPLVDHYVEKLSEMLKYFD